MYKLVRILIAGMMLVRFLGVVGINFSLPTQICYAQEAVEEEVQKVANTIRNIIKIITKVLAFACFVVGGFLLATGKGAWAVAAFLGGLILGFAETIANAVFK